MNIMTDGNGFQNIPLFATLSSEIMGDLLKIAQFREIPEGATIIKEGERGDRFAVILEGQVEIIRSAGFSGEHSLAIRGPGDFLGEMSILASDHLRTATVVTRTPVRLIEITQSSFQQLVERQPAFSIELLREVTRRLQDSETATIQRLTAKNRELEIAYAELQAAQSQIIEKEKMEYELQMARRIQEDILPKHLPNLAGWKIQAYWHPARELGGDFYEFIPLGNKSMGLVIGDVSGHGVPASLGMATTHSILRMASGGQVTPGKVLKRANLHLYPDISSSSFVTCQYAIVDQDSGHVTIANAGHPFPIICGSGQAKEVEIRGIALGVLENSTYSECQIELEPGNCMVMYSDGLSECENDQGEMFGPHLIGTLSTQKPDNGWVQYLLDRMHEFTGPAVEQFDDVTILTIERVPV